MENEKRLPQRLSLNDTATNWKNMEQMRSVTLPLLNKYLKKKKKESLSANKIVLRALERINPKDLYEDGFIDKEVYKQFMNDYIDGNIKVSKDKLSLLKL